MVQQQNSQYTLLQVPRLYYKYSQIWPCKYGCGKQIFIALVEIPDRKGVKRNVPFEVEGKQYKHNCEKKPDIGQLYHQKK